MRDSEGLKSTVILSGMVIILPVLGWRTFLEDRFSLVKEPKPRKNILSPFLRSSIISDRMNFMISRDSTWVRKNLFEIEIVSSFWFILIGALPAVRSCHENYLFLFINFIEKSVVAYSIAPGFGLVAGEFFYVFAEIRV